VLLLQDLLLLNTSLADPSHGLLSRSLSLLLLLLLLSLWCAGSVLLLQDLLLLNTSLADPTQGDVATAFLPTSLRLPRGALLKLRDVIMVVDQDTLLAYIAFLRSVRGMARVTYTDDRTFLHVRNYSASPFAAVQVRSVTLVAPRAASVRGTPVSNLAPYLPPGSSSSSSNGGCSAAVVARVSAQQRVAEETVTAACGDSAGVITVTDSYILGANNVTLLPLLRQLASGPEDESRQRQPLLVIFSSNVTLASSVWGRQWPTGGVVLRRPVAWVGSSSLPTSVDFRMEIGQVCARVSRGGGYVVWRVGLGCPGAGGAWWRGLTAAAYLPASRQPPGWGTLASPAMQ
jgi:hypothetical protein